MTNNNHFKPFCNISNPYCTYLENIFLNQKSHVCEAVQIIILCVEKPVALQFCRHGAQKIESLSLFFGILWHPLQMQLNDQCCMAFKKLSNHFTIIWVIIPCNSNAAFQFLLIGPWIALNQRPQLLWQEINFFHSYRCPVSCAYEIPVVVISAMRLYVLGQVNISYFQCPLLQYFGDNQVWQKHYFVDQG